MTVSSRFPESIEDTGEKGKCSIMLFNLQHSLNFQWLQLFGAELSFGREEVQLKHYNQAQLQKPLFRVWCPERS